ncbi:hypothetical protein PMAC_002882 [Pneumocystis sp. 'macacae']|nr:hypothetical protein PMAC_002882 [Pneumocystis sp. 'macacae']
MASNIELYKLVILGDGAVGKTALATQIYDPTIEDSYRKQVIVDGRSCILEILDTAGQEEYIALRDQWIKNGDGFLLVYSVSSRPTFDRVKRFREQIVQTKDTKSVPLILVGNKSDRIYDREISFEEGQSLADFFGCQFAETSAKSSVNVELVFYNLIKAIRNIKTTKNQTVLKRDRKNVMSCILSGLCGYDIVKYGLNYYEFKLEMIRDCTSVCLDNEIHGYDICSDSYNIELSDGECSYTQNIQENLMAYVNKLKYEIAYRDKDREKLFCDYENLQEKYNNLLLSYESLKISSSKQLVDLRTQLSFLASEMDKNMNCAREELETKTIQLGKMKQKLEKLRNANRMANEHIGTLQANFNLERGRWKEEKIRLSSNKYSIKKMKELEELMLLHTQSENMRFEVPETRENSVHTTSTSSINAIHEDMITSNSFDHFFSSKTLAAELSLCSDINQGSNIQILQLTDFLDRNNSRILSKAILDSENYENTIMMTPDDCIIKHTSKNNTNLQTDMAVLREKFKELPENTSSSVCPVQEIMVLEKTATLNTVQKNTNDSLKFENLNLLKFKESTKNVLNQKRYASSVTNLFKRQVFSIYPPLPIPIRKTSLTFKKVTLSCKMANITLKIPENKGSYYTCFNKLRITSNILYKNGLNRFLKRSLTVSDVPNSRRKLFARRSFFASL